MTIPIAIIDGISKSFNGMQRPALNAISTQIMPGKITGLVGPDGAGKTTFIRLLIGLLKKDSGKINIDGLDIDSQFQAIHTISGYMPQRFGLYEDLSVIENLNLYANLRNVIGSKRKERFDRLLKFTNLQTFQNLLASKLSGGMKQKLGLACALIGSPKILLLDEPSVGVDPISRRELWKIAMELLAEGTAILWSTSYLDEADKCDTVILLNEGKKLYDGPPANLLKNVAGRTWQIRDISLNKRHQVLLDMQKNPDVIDSVIQGSNIRIVLGKDKKLPILQYGEWLSIPSIFEDSFIDILGGGSGMHSVLADEMSAKSLNNKPVIDAQNLTKRFYDFVAVKNVSFQIKQGEIFGLLGPNGAGKSTTFKMMCGLLQPTEGNAFVKGVNLKTAPTQARARIGYMAQKFSLYGALNITQNLNFFAGLYGLSGQQKRHQINLMIEIFALQPYLKINANMLPLGFKQRLALACAVMHQPDVLFLDEPTSGVDPITRREFWTHINAMVNKGVTIMVTTHFMDEAEYCDRIGLIYRGENIATGTPNTLKDLVKSARLPNPTLEDAFIALVNKSDSI